MKNYISTSKLTVHHLGDMDSGLPRIEADGLPGSPRKMHAFLLAISNSSNGPQSFLIFAVVAVASIASIYYFNRLTSPSSNSKTNNQDGVDSSPSAAGKKKSVVREWTVTKVQKSYIEKIAEKYSVDISWVVTRLILQANREDNKRKKFIFRVVRCDNCTQSSTGGYKVPLQLELDAMHAKWLENVFEKCNHASVDKTLRILLDFYISVVLKDDDMERRFFGAIPN